MLQHVGSMLYKPQLPKHVEHSMVKQRETHLPIRKPEEMAWHGSRPPSTSNINSLLAQLSVSPSLRSQTQHQIQPQPSPPPPPQKKKKATLPPLKKNKKRPSNRNPTNVTQQPTHFSTSPPNTPSVLRHRIASVQFMACNSQSCSKTLDT